MSANETEWKVLARELTGWEVMKRIEAGDDAALLPVGSMEMHGPELPLGTDTYVAEAACRLAAPLMRGTVFDTITYTWPGMTKYSMPTISMTMDMETSYVRMVCDQLLRIGFRRLYVVQWHGPGIALSRLTREFFEETGVPLIFYGLMRVPNDGAQECRDAGIDREASLCAAAASLMGYSPTIDPSAKPADATPQPPRASAARQAIRESGGFMGHLGNHDYQHGNLSGRVDPEMGLDILHRFAKTMASSAPHAAEVRDAWEGVDLETSWPSSIRGK